MAPLDDVRAKWYFCHKFKIFEWHNFA